MKALTQPVLSVIIVSYNTKMLLLDCIESLYEKLGDIEHEIIVVDNNSNDGSMEAVAEKFKSVRVIQNTRNLGFAQANNQAFEVARGQYYLLLNTDTVLLSSPKRVIDFMENNPDAGIVGVKLVFGNGSLQRSCWRYPNILLEWLYYSVDILHCVFPAISRLKYRGIDYKKADAVDCVSGNGMFIRAELLKQIKGFDSSFFMYHEDTDLCYRVNKTSRFRVYYYPEYTIVHYHGKSSPKSMATVWSFKSYIYLLNKIGEKKLTVTFMMICKLSWFTSRIALTTAGIFCKNPKIGIKINLLRELSHIKVMDK